jgi:hypothetical protein
MADEIIKSGRQVIPNRPAQHHNAGMHRPKCPNYGTNFSTATDTAL